MHYMAGSVWRLGACVHVLVILRFFACFSMVNCESEHGFH
jgi:hypothetical protein